jgi:hypothetical protein
MRSAGGHGSNGCHSTSAARATNVGTASTGAEAIMAPPFPTPDGWRPKTRRHPGTMRRQPPDDPRFPPPRATPETDRAAGHQMREGQNGPEAHPPGALSLHPAGRPPASRHPIDIRRPAFQMRRDQKAHGPQVQFVPSPRVTHNVMRESHARNARDVTSQ